MGEEYNLMIKNLQIGDKIEVTDIVENGCGKERWKTLVLKISETKTLLLIDDNTWELIDNEEEK